VIKGFTVASEDERGGVYSRGKIFNCILALAEGSFRKGGGEQSGGGTSWLVKGIFGGVDWVRWVWEREGAAEESEHGRNGQPISKLDSVVRSVGE